MTCRTDDYVYTESGLDNIVLENIEICECQCGEKVVAIPNVEEINKHIGHVLAMKKSRLNGKEIRFLRKNMGFTAIELAKLIGVDNATISRWERGIQRISKSNDRFLKLLFTNLRGYPKWQIKRVIEDNFGQILEKEEDALHRVPTTIH